MLRHTSRCVLFLVLAASGCHTVPEAEPPLSFTLVLLKTGPRTEPLTAAEQKEVFGGHFAGE